MKQWLQAVLSGMTRSPTESSATSDFALRVGGAAGDRTVLVGAPHRS